MAENNRSYRHVPINTSFNTPMPSQMQITPTFPTYNPAQPFSPVAQTPLDSALQMRRMSEDMSEMYRQMQRQVANNLGNVGGDTWLNEDLRMDNPIETNPATGKQKFKLHFDLHQFQPEEIRIITEGRNLTVSAKHEETQEGRSVNRQYNRSYVLPDNLDPEALTSTFTAGGILNIEGPIQEKKDAVIAIEHKK